MGDMADMALEDAESHMEVYYRHENSSLQTQYEAGLIDEIGETIGKPWSVPATTYKSSLRGLNCPKCRNSMVVRMGQYGKFLGCSHFPTCKGSRSV